MIIQRARPSPRLLALALSGIAWSSAHAQSEPPSGGIQEVVVTAERSAARDVSSDAPAYRR
jgi:outer membrane cobalamin receptor